MFPRNSKTEHRRCWW